VSGNSYWRLDETNRKMRFGVFLPTWDFDPNAGRDNKAGGTPVAWDDILARAKLCEELEFYSVLVGEHLLRGRGGNILEPWTVLSAVATATSDIRLGQFVMCNEFRHPAVFAKMVSTLDVVSEGRVEVGLGAGWMDQEFVSNGIPWDPAPVRIGRLRESVEVLRKLFTEERTSFSGRYYHLTDGICEPKPIQKPHPPIWIGGDGEEYLLRTVASVGDGCNFGGSPETYAKKLQVLRRHCGDVGRDFGVIMRSWNGALIIARSESEISQRLRAAKPTAQTEDEFRSRQIVGTPSRCIRRIEEYASLGVDYITIHGTSRMTDDELRLFAREVLPSF